MEKKKIAFLQYWFDIVAGEPWTHVSDFERDLSDFFSAYGLEAEVINGLGGQPGFRVLRIRRVDTFLKDVDKKEQEVTKEPFKKVIENIPTGKKNTYSVKEQT